MLNCEVDPKKLKVLKKVKKKLILKSQDEKMNLSEFFFKILKFK